MSGIRKINNLAGIKFFVSVLVIYTTLITFQISNTVQNYKNTAQYYSYFLAVASLIFLLKVFFVGYKSILARYSEFKNLQFLVNILLTSGGIWLLNLANNILTFTSYPKDFFGLFILANLCFLLLLVLNKTINFARQVLFSLAYLVVIYLLYFFQTITFSVIYLQISSFLVIVFELAQLYRVLDWEFAGTSKLSLK
jgi:hypothetical protein